MIYRSKFTDFQAFERPYTDTFYYKEKNETICIIHVDENWNMIGIPLNPFKIPIDMLNPKFEELDQKQCEQIIMRHMPPKNREDTKIKYNMRELDYATIMYRTRLINLLDNYWMAWSEDDKVEDYHPRFNKEIMNLRYSEETICEEPEDIIEDIKYDWEDDGVDLNEPGPYGWTPDNETIY